MAEAGADILVAHMGLTTGGAIGAGTALTLEDSVARVNAIAEAARAARPDGIVLCHSRPIATPADAAFALSRCPGCHGCHGCHGFYGASSMERLPAETAPTDAARAFKAVRR